MEDGEWRMGDKSLSLNDGINHGGHGVRKEEGKVKGEE
jgi:hypothetical protein